MEVDPYHDTGFPSTSAALPAALSGWSSCRSFARYAKFKREFPSQFPKLKGGPERAVRHFIMSAEIPPERLLELVRSRRGIENGLRRVLDVVMDEVRMRNRSLNGPECLSALRRVAPDIASLMDDDRSLKGRMHIASMNGECLLDFLANAVRKL